jgi:hypothetical protein
MVARSKSIVLPTTTQIAGILLDAAHQIGNRDSERLGDRLDVAKSHISLAALDSADVRSIQTAFVGERFLRQAERRALRPNAIAESLQNVHRPSHFQDRNGDFDDKSTDYASQQLLSSPMSKIIRSDQRMAVTIAAMIFGPLFVLGPLALCALLLVKTFGVPAIALSPLFVGLSAFFAYQMGQNFHWVEFDGKRVRGRKFWTRRFVDNDIGDATDIRPLGALARGNITVELTDLILGPVRGYQIRFRSGPSIYLVRHDTKNVDALVVAIAKGILAQPPVQAS